MGKKTAKLAKQAKLVKGEIVWIVTRKCPGETDKVLAALLNLKSAVNYVMNDSACLEGPTSVVDLVHQDHEAEEYRYECGDYTYDVVTTEVC